MASDVVIPPCPYCHQDTLEVIPGSTYFRCTNNIVIDDCQAFKLRHKLKMTVRQDKGEGNVKISVECVQCTEQEWLELNGQHAQKNGHKKIKKRGKKFDIRHDYRPVARRGQKR